ncbi:glycosyltransferase [Bosea sp. NPDC055594]
MNLMRLTRKFRPSSKKPLPADEAFSAGGKDDKFIRDLITKADGLRDAHAWREAAETYAQVVAVAAGEAGLWVQYAHALKESGQLGEAATAYRRAAELAPEDADPWVHLAHLLKRLDDPGTREAFEAVKALSKDPRILAETDEELQILVLRAAARRGQKPEAPHAEPTREVEGQTSAKGNSARRKERPAPQRFSGSVDGLRNGRIIVGRARDTAGEHPAKVVVKSGERQIEGLACHFSTVSGSFDGFQIELPEDIEIGTPVEVFLEDGTPLTIPGGDMSAGSDAPGAGEAFVDTDLAGSVRGWFIVPFERLSSISLKLDGALAGSAYLQPKSLAGTDAVAFHFTPPQLFVDGQTRIAVVEAYTDTGPIELARFRKAFVADATPGLRWGRLAFDAGRLVGSVYGAPRPDLSIVLAARDFPLTSTLAVVEEADISAGFGRARFSLDLSSVGALDLDSELTLEAPASLALQRLPLASLLAAAAQAEQVSPGVFDIALPAAVNGTAIVEVTTQRGETLRRAIRAAGTAQLRAVFDEKEDERSREGAAVSFGALAKDDVIATLALFGLPVRLHGNAEAREQKARAIAPRSLRERDVQMALRAGGGTLRGDGRVDACGVWTISGELISGWAANLSVIAEPLELVITADNGRSVRVTADAPAHAREAGLAEPLPCGFAVPLARLLQPGERAGLTLTFEDGQPFGPQREGQLPVDAPGVVEAARAIDDALVSAGIERAFLLAIAQADRHPQLVARRLVLDCLLRDEMDDPADLYGSFENVLGVNEIRQGLAAVAGAHRAKRLALLPPEWIAAFSEEARATLAEEDADEGIGARRARWLCLRQLLQVPQVDLLEALDATATVTVVTDAAEHTGDDAIHLRGDVGMARPVGAVIWPVLAYLSGSQQIVSLQGYQSRFGARRLLIGARLEGGRRAGQPALAIAEFPVVETGKVDALQSAAGAISVVDLRDEAPETWVERARARLIALIGEATPDEPVLVMSPALSYDASFRDDALRAYERTGRRSTAFAAMTWDLRKSTLQLVLAGDHATIARIDFAVWRADDLAKLVSNDLPLVIPEQPLPVEGAAFHRSQPELLTWMEGGISHADLDRIVQAERHQLARINRIAASEAAAALPAATFPQALELAERLIELGLPQLAHQGMKSALAAPNLLAGVVEDGQLTALASLSRRLSLEPDFAAAFCPHAPHLARNCPSALTAVGEALAATLEPDALASMLTLILQGGLTSKSARPVFRAFDLIARYCSPSTIWTALVQIDDSRPSLLSEPDFARIVATAIVANGLQPDLRLRGSGLALADLLVFADPSAVLTSSLRSADPEAVRQAVIRFFASGRSVKEFAALTRTYSVELQAMGLRCADLIDPSRFDERDQLLAAVLLGDRETMQQFVSRVPVEAEVEAPLYLAAQTRLDDFSGFNRTIARLCHERGVEPVTFGTGGLATVFGGIMTAERAARSEVTRAGKVAVICSVFNPDLDLMRQVMLSLAAQSYSDLDVIVIDDGSDEIEPEQIQEAALVDQRFRFHRMPRNVGPYDCRNWAIRHSDAPFVAINDCDDFAHPQKIETQIATMTHNPHVRLSTTAHVRLDYQGRPQLEHTLEIFGDGPMTSVFHRSLFEQFGLFASVRSRGDVEFRERIRNWAGVHAIHHDPCPLMYCLATPQSLSNTAASTRGHYLALLRDTFMKRAELLALGAETAGALPLTVPFPLRPTSASL